MKDTKNEPLHTVFERRFGYILIGLSLVVGAFVFTASQLQKTMSSSAAFCITMIIFGLAIFLTIRTIRYQEKIKEKALYALQDSSGKDVVIAPHGWEAMRAANVTPNRESPAWIVNIGLIALWNRQTAYLYHSHAIPVTAEALQPYIEIHFNRMQKWNITFEIRDQYNDRVFYHGINQFFGAATRLLIPPASVPLHKLTHNGDWTLHVWLNGAPLAKHIFRWRYDNIETLEGNIESDGEVDDSVLALLADNYAQPLSLDDLLAQRSDTLSSDKP
jgi:hypothetical protein